MMGPLIRCRWSAFPVTSSSACFPGTSDLSIGNRRSRRGLECIRARIRSGYDPIVTRGLAFMNVPQVSVSFSGCGFLGLYHVGALACFNDNKHRVQIQHALGASAGSMVALATVLDLPIDMLRTRFIDVAQEVNRLPFGAFNPRFNVSQMFGQELERVLPENAHLRASGRLSISLSDLTLQNRLVSGFESRQELIDAVVCSCFLPAFSAYQVPTWRGQTFMDGGFSNNQPTLDRQTIRISPFASGSHICPRDQPSQYANLVSTTTTRFGQEEVEVSTMNIKRLLKTFRPTEDLESLYEEGYNDTLTFLESDHLSHHFISVIGDGDPVGN